MSQVSGIVGARKASAEHLVKVSKRNGKIDEEDVIYCSVSPIRMSVLQQLSKRDDSISLVELSKMVREGKSKVAFHCNGLKERLLIDGKKVAHQLYYRITEKGRRSLQMCEEKSRNER